MSDGVVQVPSLPNGIPIDNAVVTNNEGKEVYRQKVEIYSKDGTPIEIANPEGEPITIVMDSQVTQEGITYQKTQDEVLASSLNQVNSTLKQILFQLQCITDVQGDING